MPKPCTHQGQAGAKSARRWTRRHATLRWGTKLNLTVTGQRLCFTPTSTTRYTTKTGWFESSNCLSSAMLPSKCSWLRPAQRVQNSLTAATTEQPTLMMVPEQFCMEMVHQMDVHLSLKHSHLSKLHKWLPSAVHHPEDGSDCARMATLTLQIIVGGNSRGETTRDVYVL